MSVQVTKVPHPAPSGVFTSILIVVAVVGVPLGIAAVGQRYGLTLTELAFPMLLAMPCSVLLIGILGLFHKIKIRRTAGEVKVLGKRLKAGVGEVLVTFDGEYRFSKQRGANSSGMKTNDYFYRIEHVAAGRTVTICKEAKSAAHARAFSEGLAKLGGWPLHWKSGRSEELRSASELDMPLGQRLKRGGPPPCLWGQSATASFIETSSSSGVVITPKPEKLSTFKWVLVMLLVTLSISGASVQFENSDVLLGFGYFFFIGSSLVTPVYLAVNAKYNWLPSQIQIDTTGVTTRYRFLNRTTLFKTHVAADRIEGVFAESVLERSRVMLVGDNLFRELRLVLEPSDLGRVNYLVEMAIAGFTPLQRPREEAGDRPAETSG